MANKAGAKVVYLGDKLQLQGVEAGKPFELAQTHGIATAHMTEISRQKTSELKSVVDTLTGRDELPLGERITNVALKHNERAFAAMDKAGMIKEINLPGTDVINELVKDIIAMSKSEREQTIVITAFNKDRQKINDGVRAGMKDMGELAKTDQNREILESKGWTRAVIKEAQYYKAGDVVRFGREYKTLGIEKGAYMEVAGTNGSRGVVLLKKEDGTELAWKPHANNNVEVYETKARGLAEGDLIRLTRNGGAFKNGEVGRVTALDGDKATIQMRGGKEAAPQQIDLANNKHWDHAYASTIHAAQGTTSHRTMFHISAPDVTDEQKQNKELEQMAKVFGDRSFYVGATRASHNLQIYTNNKAAASKAISGKQDKTSAIETIESQQRVGLHSGKVTDVSR
jgi:ATP-dependent exoDNAse (exonuclease V) alpha subunit